VATELWPLYRDENVSLDNLSKPKAEAVSFDEFLEVNRYGEPRLAEEKRARF
jgi:hypothetical protein